MQQRAVDPAGPGPLTQTMSKLVALLRHIGHLDSHVRQIVAIIVALVTFLFFHQPELSIITHFIAIWDVYAFVVVLMAWITICTANPRNIQRRVRLQDSSRALIFSFVNCGRMHQLACRDSGSPGTQGAPKNP
jgi:hypothetical protein